MEIELKKYMFDNADKITAGRQARKEFRARYNTKMWSEIVDLVKKKAFPIKKMTALAIDDVSRRLRVISASHYLDRDKHATQKYVLYERIDKQGFFGVEWSYDICAECKEVVKRDAVVINNIENLVTRIDTRADMTVKDVQNDALKLLDGGLF